ncbi:NADH-quinone oxidoreductase subunit M, partial [Pseudoxanthomonas sp. SGD-10]
MGLLSVIIFLPLLFGIIILALPSKWDKNFKYISLVLSVLQLILASYLYFGFNPASGGVNEITGYQFTEQLEWIRLNAGSFGTLQIDYFVGVDGFSVALVWLSAFVMLIATLASWEIKSNQKGYYALLMLLNTATVGVFCAL